MQDMNAAKRLQQALRLVEDLQIHPMGDWPTPAKRLDELSKRTRREIWAKRDDLSSTQYGGNKVRKLEFLIGEARQRGAKSLVTVGGMGSHQIISTALVGNQLNLETHALVFRQPATNYVRENIQLASSLGVHLVPLESPDHLVDAMAQCRAQQPSYLIPTGGSSATGNLGLVAAAFELREQIEQRLLPHPKAIFVPAGSGGTMAGLALGCALATLDIQVIGVAVANESDINMEVVQRQISGITRMLRRRGAEMCLPDTVTHIELVRAPGSYGETTREASMAIELAHETEGLKLEPTYSAKAFAQMLGQVGNADFPHPALFWLTCNGRDLQGLLGSHREPLPALLAEWLEGNR